MKHKLTHYEISFLCQLNFDCSYFRTYHYYKTDYQTKESFWENDSYVQHQKPTWDKLFSLLLKENKDYQPIIDNFWMQAKTEKYIESLAGKTFSDKIEINTIYPLIFNVCSSYSGNNERKDFVKLMINHEPWLMNELHKLLKIKSDNVLLASYVDLLPKYISEIKDNQKEIFNVLNKTKEFTESNAIKVLNSIIKSFPKDEQTYIFLKEHFNDSFEQFHNLREKFQKNESKYFLNLKKDNINNLFEFEQEYVYIINIKDSILIDTFKVDKNNVRDFKNQLNECFKDIIASNIGEHIYYNSSDKGFEIHSNKINDQILIEPLMTKIKDYLPQILQTTAPIYQLGQKEILSNAFNSTLLKISLDKDLPENYTVKSKSVKI